MIGLGITYSVTGGSSLHNFYTIVCEKNAMGECHSAGLSVWIIVFSAIHLILIQVSMPLHAYMLHKPLPLLQSPPSHPPPTPPPLPHPSLHFVHPVSCMTAPVIMSDLTPGILVVAATVLTRSDLSLPLPKCVLIILKSCLTILQQCCAVLRLMYERACGDHMSNQLPVKKMTLLHKSQTSLPHIHTCHAPCPCKRCGLWCRHPTSTRCLESLWQQLSCHCPTPPLPLLAP